jgi:hypothetical protein
MIALAVSIASRCQGDRMNAPLHQFARCGFLAGSVRCPRPIRVLVNASTVGRCAVPDIAHIADVKPYHRTHGVIRDFWIPFCTCGWESAFKWIDVEDARAQASVHVAVVSL